MNSKAVIALTAGLAGLAMAGCALESGTPADERSQDTQSEKIGSSQSDVVVAPYGAYNPPGYNPWAPGLNPPGYGGFGYGVGMNPPGYNPPGYDPYNPGLNPPGYNPPGYGGYGYGGVMNPPGYNPPGYDPYNPGLNPPGYNPPGYGY